MGGHKWGILKWPSGLYVADNERVRRVAVPAISMGVYAYPPEEAVPILVNSAFEIRYQLEHIDEIRFVVLTKSLSQMFWAEIKKASKREIV